MYKIREFAFSYFFDILPLVLCSSVSEWEANTKDMPKDEWLKKRKYGIGGSDASSILGFNPYKSSMAVYLDKIDDEIRFAHVANDFVRCLKFHFVHFIFSLHLNYENQRFSSKKTCIRSSSSN